ncbi:hypothetical protein GP486_007470, partial [Trichoglossum hirsutum]
MAKSQDYQPFSLVNVSTVKLYHSPLAHDTEPSPSPSPDVFRVSSSDDPRNVATEAIVNQRNEIGDDAVILQHCPPRHPTEPAGSLNWDIIDPGASGQPGAPTTAVKKDALAIMRDDPQAQSCEKRIETNEPNGPTDKTAADIVQIESPKIKDAAFLNPDEPQASPPPLKSREEITHAIFDILERYRLRRVIGAGRACKGPAIFFPRVLAKVKAQEPVRMVLPGFPFKSPNRVEKVLGALPDRGEEVALAHLENLCRAVDEIYEGGSQLVIVSDGLVYNDLLGVSDEDVWAYGSALRHFAHREDFNHIHFVRLRDLLGIPASENGDLDKERFLKEAPYLRKRLYEENIPSSFDPSVLIAEDEDTRMTYCGYIKFLVKDLACTTQSNRAGAKAVSKSRIKRRNEEIAKKMICRGKAFASLIEKMFPDSVRLSIHPSSEATKISVSLIPESGSTMTPWHSSLAVKVDGSVRMGHADLFRSDEAYELVMREGRPYYFREKSELFHWDGLGVEFEHMYPCGLLILSVNNSPQPSLEDVPMKKVRKLAELTSPVVLRGFAHSTDREVFISKAYDLGTVLPWTFGILQEVKDIGRSDRMGNNVVSSEAMPMHYDGMFKFVKQVLPGGREEMVAAPP